MILDTTRAVRAFAYPRPTDLRKAMVVVASSASELALFIEGCELIGGPRPAHRSSQGGRPVRVATTTSD
jgi:hypothetical protein